MSKLVNPAIDSNLVYIAAVCSNCSRMLFQSTDLHKNEVANNWANINIAICKQELACPDGCNDSFDVEIVQSFNDQPCLLLDKNCMVIGNPESETQETEIIVSSKEIDPLSILDIRL